MILDKTGREFIQSAEGLRLKAYRDSGGLPTIGYGTTIYPSGFKVKITDTCTPQQADIYFIHDIDQFERSVSGKILNKSDIDAGVTRDIPVLTQNQFNALVSLCYNIGSANFAGSTVRKIVNSKDRNNHEKISPAFLAWDKVRVNGVLEYSEGLSNRRKLEVLLYFTTP